MLLDKIAALLLQVDDLALKIINLVLQLVLFAFS